MFVNAGRWHSQWVVVIRSLVGKGSIGKEFFFPMNLCSKFDKPWMFFLVEFWRKMWLASFDFFEATSGFVVQRALPCYTLEKKSLATSENIDTRTHTQMMRTHTTMKSALGSNILVFLSPFL